MSCRYYANVIPAPGQFRVKILSISSGFQVDYVNFISKFCQFHAKKFQFYTKNLSISSQFTVNFTISMAHTNLMSKSCKFQVYFMFIPCYKRVNLMADTNLMSKSCQPLSAPSCQPMCHYCVIYMIICRHHVTIMSALQSMPRQHCVIFLFTTPKMSIAMLAYRRQPTRPNCYHSRYSRHQT